MASIRRRLKNYLQLPSKIIAQGINGTYLPYLWWEKKRRIAEQTFPEVRVGIKRGVKVEHLEKQVKTKAQKRRWSNQRVG